MVKITALFGHPENVEEFENYYLNTHTPIAEKIPNLQRFDKGKVVRTPDGGRPAFYRIADLWFNSMAEMQSGLGSPEGQTASQDFQNFATGGVTILISDVSDS